jgi:hypothetical protein
MIQKTGGRLPKGITKVKNSLGEVFKEVHTL